MFRRWYAEAGRAGVPLVESMALATADRRGRPSVRYVLLKSVNDAGFVFFTNARSPKGRELRANPQAALAFYWDATGRQVRVEGRVTEVSANEADAYWETRPEDSRFAAWSSRQSAPLSSRSALLARWRNLRASHRDGVIPRPPEWTGFRVAPRTIEFWTRGDHRLHHRERFTRTRAGWTRTLLQP
jgi:pyridoxamine 5'-phosphate oxidase